MCVNTYEKYTSVLNRGNSKFRVTSKTPTPQNR